MKIDSSIHFRFRSAHWYDTVSLQIRQILQITMWHLNGIDVPVQNLRNYLDNNITKAALLEIFQSRTFSLQIRRLFIQASKVEGLIEILAVDLGKAAATLDKTFKMMTDLQIPLVTRNNLRELAVVQEAQKTTSSHIQG